MDKTTFTGYVEHGSTGATESPREYECSTMFGFHRKFWTPDEPPHTDPEKAKKIAYATKNICLPVWLLDHSGTTYVAAPENPFQCDGDSGLFGFIFITRKDARYTFGISRITENVRLKILADLTMQVQLYSQWSNGDMYCWTIKNDVGDIMESCGGYYSKELAQEDMQDCLTSYNTQQKGHTQ